MAKPDRPKPSYVDAQIYAMLEAIRKRLARDAGWRVVARGKDWLCPYCGETGFSDFEEHKAPRNILRHLLNECPHWSEEVGTRFSHKQLVAKARRLETEDLLRTQRGWRMADKVGHWYCPYCAQATDVPWKADSNDPSPPPDLVHAHLERCPVQRGGAKPFSFNALQAVIQDADRYRELTVGVRCRMAQEASWRQMTKEGKWLCPRCRQVVPEVDLSSEPERMALAPVRIARHLMERCKPRAAGAPGAAAAPAGPPARAPEPEGDVLILQSTSILDALPPKEDAAPLAAAPAASAPSPAPGPARMAPSAPDARPLGAMGAPAVSLGRAAASTAPHGSRQDRATVALRKALPTEQPLLQGYDIHCLHQPAGEAGGTFYDHFYLSPENLAIVVCALPTRGADAVRAISAFRKALRRHSQYHQSPAEVLRRTNEDIAAHRDARAFITALYGVLDAHAGFFTYARAGHSMPILLNRGDEPPVRELSSKGLALGIQQGQSFDQAIEDVAIRFRPGDTLVLYAGAVTEAENARGEPYGIARLGAAIEQARSEVSSRALATGVFEDIRRFLGEAPQKDDVTLLCLRKP